ncbi:isocitrate lyase/PEP mutase family protein [Natronomonas marina]|uniref:isocitrate lyase/PEP mutase family protein n=1 Tax=Natronomonas marina TaxID=2961939 RepID=UPI0020CA1CDD|nr:isocitrate lyase/PEP mutase family protein [Natronomonas marina]
MADSTNLRELVEREEILVCPGAHDPLTAAVEDRLDFEAIYMTGYGTSLSRTGYPDAGFITMPEMVDNAAAIQERVDVPVIADADNGFGNATNVIRTMREFIKAGVGAVQIEDQSFPKRCGHVKGRQLVPTEEAAGKFAAAADVRDERDESVLVIGRTDARGATDGSLDEAIERVNAYCEAGADVAFVEGPVDEAEVREIGERVDAPLLYNCTGISPMLDAETLEDYGFDVVIYPGVSTRATILGLHQWVERVLTEGSSAVEELYAEFEELPIGSFHQFAGFPEVVEWEERYLPAEEEEKYDDSLGEAPGDQ